MIKNIIMVVILFCSIRLDACDACGCNPNGIGINLVDNYTRNYIGIGYSNVKFTNDNLLSGKISDYFTALNLVGRFHLSRKFKIQVSVPYSFNARKHIERNTYQNGFGDLKAELYATVLDKVTLEGTYYLEFGLGVILPTGLYDEKLLDKDIPLNFNPGRGAWGQAFSLQSVVQRNAFNLMLGGAYNLYYGHNGVDSGDQSLLYMTLSRASNIGIHKLIPSISIAYEHIQSDRYATGIKAHGTGGQVLSGGIGMSYAYENIFISGNCSLPFASSFAEGEAVNNYKIQTQITYLF